MALEPDQGKSMSFETWLDRRSRAQCWAMIAVLYLGLIGLALWEILK